MKDEQLKKELKIIWIYLVLWAITIVFGLHLIFNAFEPVRPAIIRSFWVCFLAPFVALGIFILSSIWTFFYGETLSDDWREKKRLQLPCVVISLVLSSAFLMFSADVGRRNIEGLWRELSGALVVVGVSVLFVIVWLLLKAGPYGRAVGKSRFHKPLMVGCHCILAFIFLFGAFFTANAVLDTSELQITEKTIVNVHRIGTSNRICAHVEDDDGNLTRLIVSLNFLNRFRDNPGERVLLVTWEGAFNIPHRRLATNDDGPTGIERFDRNLFPSQYTDE